MFVLEETSNEKINVKVIPIEDTELQKIQNFQFDWEKEKNFETFKLVVNGTNEILGFLSLDRNFEELRIEIRLLELSKNNIGSKRKYNRIAGILISYACKLSFQSGFYGFVSLIPKTNLINHYIETYGFVKYGLHLAIELESSESLMHKYLINE